MKKRRIISQLVHKIIFLKNTTNSEIKEPKWEPVMESFAEIKPIREHSFSSLEGMKFGNVLTEEYFLFKIRFLHGINRDMRISFSNKIFEIKRIIDEDEKGRMLSIIALKI